MHLPVLRPNLADMSIAEKIEAATPLKEEGNTFFKQGKLEESQEEYLKAVGYLSKTFGADEDESATITQLNISLNSNLAAVALKLNNPKKVKYC
jgi:hypothetical protein